MQAEPEAQVAGGDPGEERHRGARLAEAPREGRDRQAHGEGPGGDDRGERHDVGQLAQPAPDSRRKGEAD